ncbi:MAG TPA: hypothetical protein VHA37_02075, partial [Candidatus Saccharimonadales bacterium]|nr:hypothetical protein [Candidatus Saccharimonadales bacterium]
MPERPARLHILHRFRKSQRQVEDLGSQAEEQIEQHLVRRFGHLSEVRRFVFGWLALVLLLIGGLVWQNLALGGYYQSVRPVPGGIYNEGVRGR